MGLAFWPARGHARDHAGGEQGRGRIVISKASERKGRAEIWTEVEFWFGLVWFPREVAIQNDAIKPILQPNQPQWSNNHAFALLAPLFFSGIGEEQISTWNMSVGTGCTNPMLRVVGRTSRCHYAF